MNKQQGYINIDFEHLFLFAGLGLLALLFGIPYGIYWLFTHVSIVFV